MTTVTTRNNYNSDFMKNNAKVYNAGSRKKTLGEKFRDYWHETMEFYGKIYEANGYRPINFFGA